MIQLPLLLTAFLAAESGPIEIPSAVIKISEEVEVPARDPGVLAKIEVKEGQLIEEGETLARLLDTDVRLAVDRARLESEIALRKFKNDADIQYAKKSTEVARAELARSLDANAKFPKTVSNTELDRQRLLVEQGELQTKQAEHLREVAGLTHEIAENQHQTAREQLDRRTILAPLRGMVVEVLRRRGEWVQPGDTVVRIVRLDRLRVEGFLSAQHASLDLVGSKVNLRLASAEGSTSAAKPRAFPGRIVFVSPEIDPLNSQVRVWAEIENTDLQLRPGMTATLTLEK
jgi:macrolide-specific efflux system membrane fusion protein